MLRQGKGGIRPSSDSYEWEASKILKVTKTPIDCLQDNSPKSQDEDEFSAVLNRISSSKSGLKEVIALPQVCIMLCRIVQDKANFPQINLERRSSAGSQIDNAYFSKQTLDASAKGQGDEYTQLNSNDGEEHSDLVLEDKPAGTSVGCVKVVEERYVTISDINTMAARLLKAELSGNRERMDKIRSKLEQLREAQRRNIKVRLTRAVSDSSREAKHYGNFTHLVTANRDGRSAPLCVKEHEGDSFGENYNRSNIHGGKGHQNRHLSDDGDSCSVREMMRQEKLEIRNSYDVQFVSLARRCKDGVDGEYGDAFMNANVKPRSVPRSRLGSDAITDYKRREYAESTCPSCMDHISRYLVMSVRHNMFLSLPEHASLSRGHCFLTPLEHVGAMTRVDEAAVEEACAFKRDLCRMAALWKGKGASYVFMEVASYSNLFKHHVQIECVPVRREAMDELPSYFKKAMLDIGSEWDQNKRILSLERPGTGAYKAIPPNFGYFCVEFGIDGGGYAKVIEDWSAFPLHFGREVLAGVLGKSADKWRKPKKDSMEQLRRKAVEFEERWVTVERNANKHDSTTQNTEIAAATTATAVDDLEPEGPDLPPEMP
ncbi:CWF19-like protein 2 [Taenia crassiceps]|uniref:CWF19-like protein 2 n=1 Tax=Taenia crassiceps TaxID=6207 RepID=A0ABR4QPW8_9CEST